MMLMGAVKADAGPVAEAAVILDEERQRGVWAAEQDAARRPINLLLRRALRATSGLDFLQLPTREERKEFMDAVAEKQTDPSVRGSYAAACGVLRRRLNSELRRRLPGHPKDRSLASLHMGNNLMGNPGPLAAVVSVCSSLKELHLTDCNLSDAGVPAVIGGLLDSGVETVDLSGNPRVTDETARMLLTLVHRNRGVRYIRCEGCNIPRGTLRKLRERGLDNYYRDATGRSAYAAIVRTHAAVADDEGLASVRAVIDTLLQQLAVGPLPAAANLPRQCLPWPAAERQAVRLLARLRELPGRLGTAVDRRLSLESALEMVFSADTELAARVKRYEKERAARAAAGGEPPPAVQYDSRAGLRAWAPLCACDPAPGRAGWGARATAQRRAREEAVERYLCGIAAERDHPLRPRLAADGTISLRDFAAAAGLSVADAGAGLAPFKPVPHSRLSLADCGRAFC